MRSLCPSAHQFREEILTQLSGETPFVDGHIATELLPVQLGSKRNVEYFNVDPNQIIRHVDTKVTAQGAITVSGVTGTKVAALLDTYWHAAAVGQFDIEELGREVCEGLALRRSFASVSIDYEKTVADYFNSNVNLDPTVAAEGVQPASSITTAAQDPLAPILDGIIRITKRTGRRPNVVVIPLEGFLEMSAHPLVQARIYGSGSVGVSPMTVTAEQLAKAIGVAKVLVPHGAYVTTNGTEPTQIWDPTKWFVARVDTTMFADIDTLGQTRRLRMNETVAGHEQKPDLADGVMCTGWNEASPPRELIAARVDQLALRHTRWKNCIYKVHFNAGI